MRLTSTLLFASFLLADTALAAPSFVNGLAIPGDLPDQFGSEVNNGRVGFFSDIYYDPYRNDWWGLSDRGPGGGTLNYTTRAQRFTLDINSITGAISNFKITQTLLFSKGGSALNGIAPSSTNSLGNAFDPEGIVVNPKNGNLLVSDEYGPSLYEIDRNTGSVVKTYMTPTNLVPRNAASGVANFASDTGNNAGKRTNRGFEGLAISPDGNFAYAMLQSAMLDEGGGNGTVSRIVKFNTTTGEAVAQYAYQMKRANQGQGTSALVAINDHEFFVLERNNRGVGVGADLATADKEVYKIDLTGATDVSSVDLDAVGATYTKVTKSTQFLDLDADTLAALGNKSPEKWEGLAIGPKLSDDSYLLLAGTDNDYSVTQNGSNTQLDVYFNFGATNPYQASIQCPLDQTSGCVTTSDGTSAALTSDYSLLPGVLHAYKASAADLSGYVAPVPLPAAAWLFGTGLIGMLSLGKKRRS